MIEASAVGLRRAMEAHLAIETLGTRRNIPTTERCQIFNSCSLKSTTDWHDPWAEEWFAMLQMAATTTEKTMRVSATKKVAGQGCYGSQLISRNAFWMWASTLGSRRLMSDKCLDRSMFCPIWFQGRSLCIQLSDLIHQILQIVFPQCHLSFAL